MLKFGNLGEEYIGIPLEFANSFTLWNYFGIKKFFKFMYHKKIQLFVTKKTLFDCHLKLDWWKKKARFKYRYIKML